MRGGEAPARLAVEAASPLQAAAEVQARGYRVIAVRAATSWSMLQRPRRHAFSLLLFNQELLALLQAGLTLTEALESLAEKEQRPEARATLNLVIASLREGHSLSQAFGAVPREFPPMYVATVRASERTGTLAEALARYIAYQMQMDAVKRQIVSASIYPALLLVLGALVTVFLLGYVVPRFSQIYADLGADLPFGSRLLMHWGQLVEQHGLLLLGLAAAALLSPALLAARPAVRQRLGAALWRLPALGARLRSYELARFYRSLGMLLKSGMPVLASLQMVADLLPSGLRGRLVLAAARIREGLALSQAMEHNGLTTPVALRMLRVGERTGQMGEMMERIASFHEEESARWVERFTRLFEPLLMIVIGLVIGVIVALMYLPIFELAGGIR